MQAQGRQKATVNAIVKCPDEPETCFILFDGHVEAFDSLARTDDSKEVV